jgi:hypothetical protein
MFALNFRFVIFTKIKLKLSEENSENNSQGISAAYFYFAGIDTAGMVTYSNRTSTKLDG